MTVEPTGRDTDAPLGRIITFYSYKGGTGRSMAMANVAWILALNGYRVLVVDWDLEAPGIYRYLHPFLVDKELVETEGLMDMLERLAAQAASGELSEALDTIRVLDYVEPLRWPGESAFPLTWKQFGPRAGFDFMSAGRQGPAYSLKLSTFNWLDFYERLGGRRLLEEVKRQMREVYDYVLIDSRTGVSDTSGICSVEMPDTVVICFTLNNQSIRGAAGVATSIRLQQQALAKDARSRPFRIFPVPTRVEMTAEKDKREAALYLARQTFSPFLDFVPGDAQGAYWGAVQNSYYPYYAFEEIPAIFADNLDEPASLASAIRYLTRAITDPGVDRAPQFHTDPATNEKIRKEIVRWFLRPAPQTDALQLADHVYLSFDDTRRPTFKRIVLRLVGISPSANPTPRTAAWAELAEADAWMIENLVERRLLATSGSGDARDVRFADPIVVERWEKLRQWIDEDKEFLTWRTALASAVQSWKASGSTEQALILRGKALEDAERWLRARPDDLNTTEQTYIAACEKAEARARQAEEEASAAAASARARLTELEALIAQRNASSTGGGTMPSVALMEEGPKPEMLRLVWGEYRVWAMTSRDLKARITKIGLTVMGLTITGTALGTLSPLLGMGALGKMVPALAVPEVAQFVPWISAAALGVGAYLTNQLVTESERQAWIKSRAVAEALKSEAFKYATSAPPYDGAGASQKLRETVSELRRNVSGVLTAQLGPEAREWNMPQAPMSIAMYVEQRLNDQKDLYYPRAVQLHRAKIGQAKIITLAAGLITVVLGGTSNTLPWAATLLGIVTTSAAALAAWFQSGHHQELALNYQDTRATLEELAAQYAASGAADKQIVVDAEAVMQSEHAAWLAEWKSAGKSAPTAPAKAEPVAP